MRQIQREQLPAGFSMVIIPDTQVVAAKYPELLQKMSEWIVAQAEALDVKMVVHLGDVANDGDKEEQQFVISRQAIDQIEAAGIPVQVCIGNHDYDNMLAIDRSSEMYNKYFGWAQYGNKPWLGGTFEAQQLDNYYMLLEINGWKYLFLSLEFAPRDEVVNWANQLLQDHPEYRVFVITHCYMYMFGERTTLGDRHHPIEFAGASAGNDGEQLWNKLFRHHANIVAIFSGHHGRENISYRTDIGDKGNLVLQSFQNWQSTPQGGQVRIRVLSIADGGKEITMRVYNPVTGQYEQAEGYELNIPMEPGSENAILRFP
jgi:hypothetical protein